MKRSFLLFCLIVLSTACSHPLEIVGEGDIVSLTGDRDCSLEQQPCENIVFGEYKETYSAVAREGWHFVRWESSGCARQFPQCVMDISAIAVRLFWGFTVPPLKAVFEPSTTPPNILLILADDLSFDHYGFAGHSAVQTPSLDTLAAQSLQYPNAYVSSVCRPTLATLLTGLPEHVHGVTYLEGPGLGNVTTIADRLANSGYTSVQAGKFWESFPTTRGFSDYVPFDSILGNLSIGRTSIQPFLDLIDQSPTPWFAWFSPYMPHIPLEAPQQYVNLYQGLGLDAATMEYYGMISWFDSVVGELVEEMPPNTVVIYLADNGYLQSPNPQHPLPESKTTSYEHGIRTQLLIRYDRYAPAVREELVGDVDVSATLLEVAGAYRDDLPGRDVLAPPPAVPRAFGSRSTLLLPESGTLQERWIRRGDWKLVDTVDEEDRLFDLASDPGEDNNLIAAPEWSTLKDELQAEIDAWWAL